MENPDVAVTVFKVVEDAFKHDLTTKEEAAQIVDNLVDNVINGTSILKIR